MAGFVTNDTFIKLASAYLTLFQAVFLRGLAASVLLLLLAVAAVFLVIGYLFNVMAMRHGEIGFVSPFRYTILIWAILLGWMVFGDVPGPAMLIGSAIVVATGAYTFYRERQVRKRAAVAHPFGAT